jgi:flagellar biosynthetic protein FlhB
MADETEKTEKPTGRRLGEARKKGDVARSSEVDTAVFLLILLLFLKFGGPFVIYIFKEIMRYAFTHLTMPLTETNVMTLTIKYFIYFWLVVGPLGLILMVMGIVSSIVQVGWIFTTNQLKLNWNIIKLGGFKEIFSIHGFKKLAKGLIKLTILSLIVWLTIRKEIHNFMGLIFLDMSSIFIYLLKLIVKVITYLLLFYVFFAVADFFWSKYLYIKKLKMSKSEVKDEFRQMEGDPLVKNKIRSIMLQESLKRMMKDVPQADVIITNPVHLAVAIKYNPEVSEAPIVLAKGKRLIAERIKEIARENNIPIVEDKPLARLLYKNCEIGEEIDVQFYAAVAEILANVYKAKGKKNF